MKEPTKKELISLILEEIENQDFTEIQLTSLYNTIVFYKDRIEDHDQMNATDLQEQFRRINEEFLKKFQR